VSWQFDRKGSILVSKGDGATSEDDIMLVALEAGAEDISDSGDHWHVTTPPSDVNAVKGALDDAGVNVESAEVTMLASTTVALDREADAKKVLHLVDLLEEHDDVQNVYANFDIPDSVLELVSG
jgi:transcriptional/translational regulatory protein YebC/TACO1